MDWTKRIELFQNQVPFLLNILDKETFSFPSSLQTEVFGKYYQPQLPIEAIRGVILLYHGLGAVIQTPGYQELKDEWISNGFAVVGFDVRNQGGMTSGNPSRHPGGLYLSGIESIEDSYFVQMYLDSIRLVDVAKQLFPNKKIYATGGSQGGTLAIIAGMFHPDVKLVMADMPNCIDIPYLVHHANSGFQAFQTFQNGLYLQDQSFYPLLETIDLLSLAKYLTKPILLSVGSVDDVTPMVTTTKFYDLLSCEKKLIVYPGYGHGGFDSLHGTKKRQWISLHSQ